MAVLHKRELRDLHRHLQRGLLWTGVQHWGVHVIKLAVLFALARFIGPASFGVYALATILVSLAQLLSNQGMMSAVIQRHDLEDSHIGSAFLSMLGWALLLNLILVVGARPIATLLSQPQIVPQVASLIQMLSLSLPLNAISGTCITLWRRDLLYRKVALVTAGSQLGASTVAVVLAMAGAGIWSLVARQLVEAVLMLAFTFYAAPWKMLQQSSWKGYREMFHVAGPMGGVNLLILGRSRVDELIIGSWLGAEALGYYALARRQIDTVSSLIPAVIGNAFSPILSRLQRDEHRLRMVTRRAIRLMGTLAFPIFGIVAATSGEWLPLFLGQRWAPSIPLLPAFALGAAMVALLNFNLSILVATGHPRIRLMMEGVTTAVILLTTIAALPWGIRGVAYCAALAIAVLVPMELMWMSSRIPLTMQQQARALAPSLGSTLVMVCVLLALQMLMAGHWNAAWRLGVLVAAGVPFFARDIRRFGSRFRRHESPDLPDMMAGEINR